MVTKYLLFVINMSTMLIISIFITKLIRLQNNNYDNMEIDSKNILSFNTNKTFISDLYATDEKDEECKANYTPLILSFNPPVEISNPCICTIENFYNKISIENNENCDKYSKKLIELSNSFNEKNKKLERFVVNCAFANNTYNFISEQVNKIHRKSICVKYSDLNFESIYHSISNNQTINLPKSTIIDINLVPRENLYNQETINFIEIILFNSDSDYQSNTKGKELIELNDIFYLEITRLNNLEVTPILLNNLIQDILLSPYIIRDETYDFKVNVIENHINNNLSFKYLGEIGSLFNNLLLDRNKIVKETDKGLKLYTRSYAYCFNLNDYYNYKSLNDKSDILFNLNLCLFSNILFFIVINIILNDREEKVFKINKFHYAILWIICTMSLVFNFTYNLYSYIINRKSITEHYYNQILSCPQIINFTLEENYSIAQSYFILVISNQAIQIACFLFLLYNLFTYRDSNQISKDKLKSNKSLELSSRNAADESNM